MTQTILVVDDDSDLRKTLCILLRACYAVVEAPSGKEALRLISRERPQLMLLDVSMPEMNGVEVLRAAREIAPAIITIMLTAENDIEVAKSALTLGAVEYITKPFDSGYLLAEVDRLLDVPSKPSDGRPWRTVV